MVILSVKSFSFSSFFLFSKTQLKCSKKKKKKRAKWNSDSSAISDSFTKKKDTC